MKKKAEELQEFLHENGIDYTLKSNDELNHIIQDFGLGETEFHTADISRLIDENKELREKNENLIEIDKERSKENKRILRYLNEY